MRAVRGRIIWHVNIVQDKFGSPYTQAYLWELRIVHARVEPIEKRCLGNALTKFISFPSHQFVRELPSACLGIRYVRVSTLDTGDVVNAKNTLTLKMQVSSPNIDRTLISTTMEIHRE